MDFKRKVLLEALVRYLLTFGLIAFLYYPIQRGLLSASQTGKLEAIAVIMGIVSLCSLTGYFAFSYTVVAKTFWSRLSGYLCAFGLTVPLIICWLILYEVASIWVPEMREIWAFILLMLYGGILVFDLIDLMRMGLDIAATSFFEQGALASAGTSDRLSSITTILKQGQRLSYANGLIGTALLDLARNAGNDELAKDAAWILKHVDEPQHSIDAKVADAFQSYEQEHGVKEICESLRTGQAQVIADRLIAELVDIVRQQV